MGCAYASSERTLPRFIYYLGAVRPFISRPADTALCGADSPRHADRPHRAVDGECCDRAIHAHFVPFGDACRCGDVLQRFSGPGGESDWGCAARPTRADAAGGFGLPCLAGCTHVDGNACADGFASRVAPDSHRCDPIVDKPTLGDRAAQSVSPDYSQPSLGTRERDRLHGLRHRDDPGPPARRGTRRALGRTGGADRDRSRLRHRRPRDCRLAGAGQPTGDAGTIAR